MEPGESLLGVVAATYHTPDAIESVKLDGAGEGWWTAPSTILDAAAVTLHLRTKDGEKLKLMMMKGGGGLLGSLGGGETQGEGVVALTDWLRQHVARQ